MRKLLLPVAFVATIGFTACGGGSAEDVNVDDIKDACGCADAFVVIGNDMLNTIGEKSEKEAMEDEELKKALESKMEKLDELEDKCRKELKVKKDEMFECNKEVEEVMKKFEEKF